jgi:heat shock protein HslJ
MTRRSSILLFITAVSMLVLAYLMDATAEGPNVQKTQSLLGTEWWVEDIDQGGVVDRVHTTISFPEPGRVAGDGGCNRYMGGVEIDGSAITFGQLAGTMMMCPEAVMNQDRRFHQALARVVSWEVAETGLLHLKDADGQTIVRAWEVKEDNPSRQLKTE